MTHANYIQEKINAAIEAVPAIATREAHPRTSSRYVQVSTLDAINAMARDGAPGCTNQGPRPRAGTPRQAYGAAAPS